MLEIIRGRVLRVIDGDTYEVLFFLPFEIFSIQTCRLFGVDTWEPRGDNRLKGKQASKAVKELIEGKEFEFMLCGYGSFGRVLIDFDLNGEPIAYYLHNQGFVKSG